MRLALITDVHFGADVYHRGKLRKMSTLAGELTREFVDLMNTSARPDLVVNLGDVIEDENHDADRRNYEQFVQLLAGLDAEVFHVAGNHDVVHLSDAELDELWRRDAPGRVDSDGESPRTVSRPEPLHYSRDRHGFHLVFLRTQYNSGIDVRLPEEQCRFVERDLAATNLPTLVFLHHPLSEMRLEGNRWFEGRPNICRVAERRAVRRILEQSGKVVAVFNGHVHWNHLDVIAGIPYFTLQSLTENLDDDAPGRPSRAHAVVDIDPHRMLVRVLGEEPQRFQLELPRSQANAR